MRMTPMAAATPGPDWKLTATAPSRGSSPSAWSGTIILVETFPSSGGATRQHRVKPHFSASAAHSHAGDAAPASRRMTSHLGSLVQLVRFTAAFSVVVYFFLYGAFRSIHDSAPRSDNVTGNLMSGITVPGQFPPLCSRLKYINTYWTDFRRVTLLHP